MASDFFVSFSAYQTSVVSLGSASSENKTTNFTPGLEVIKREYSLRLKIKRNDWVKSENELKFYNLEASKVM